MAKTSTPSASFRRVTATRCASHHATQFASNLIRLQETLIEPGTEMRVLLVHRCPHASYDACKAAGGGTTAAGACPHAFKDFVRYHSLSLLLMPRVPVVALTLLSPRVQMLINVNSANMIDLKRLPQVGPARSFKIYYEAKSGGFRNRADFSRVNGFGMKSSYWSPLSEFVTFGPEKAVHTPSESEKYDNEMMYRKQCDYVAKLPLGPDHPWGAKWKP